MRLREVEVEEELVRLGASPRVHTQNGRMHDDALDIVATTEGGDAWTKVEHGVAQDANPNARVVVQSRSKGREARRGRAPGRRRPPPT